MTDGRVRLAGDIIEARRLARWLLGSDYAARMEHWTRFIRLAMERESVPPLKAVLILSKLSGEPMHHLFLTAAAVEVIEQDSATGASA